MLDELKSNEETVLEAWNLIWSPGQDTVKETIVWEFMLKIHNSSNSSKNSIFKQFCLTWSSNLVSEE